MSNTAKQEEMKWETFRKTATDWVTIGMKGNGGRLTPPFVGQSCELRPPDVISNLSHRGQARVGNIKRKRQKASRSMDESWYLRVLTVMPSYWISKNPFYGKEGEHKPFYERAAIKLEAEVLQPTRFSGRRVELQVSGDRAVASGLGDPFQEGLNPEGHFGNIYMRGQQSQFLLTIPNDMIAFLLGIMQQQHPKDVYLSADALVRGTAAIRSFEFGADFEKDNALEQSLRAPAPQSKVHSPGQEG